MLSSTILAPLCLDISGAFCCLPSQHRPSQLHLQATRRLRAIHLFTPSSILKTLTEHSLWHNDEPNCEPIVHGWRRLIEQLERCIQPQTETAAEKDIEVVGLPGVSLSPHSSFKALRSLTSSRKPSLIAPALARCPIVWCPLAERLSLSTCGVGCSVSSLRLTHRCAIRLANISFSRSESTSQYNYYYYH